MNARKELPADFLQTMQNRLLSIAAQTAAYSTWSDEFSRKEIQSVWSLSAIDPARKLSIEEIRTIPERQLLALGFRHFDETHWLIPLWAWHCIKDGEQLYCITDETLTKSNELDLDQRFGCVAYGWADPESSETQEEPSPDVQDTP